MASMKTWSPEEKAAFIAEFWADHPDQCPHTGWVNGDICKNCGAPTKK